MPDEVTFQISGLDELRRGAASIDQSIDAATKPVASATAARVLANVRANLASRTHGQGVTASTLEIVEDAPNQQYIVRYNLAQLVRTGRPANLPLWLEYGFISRKAKRTIAGLHVMHDGARAEDAQFATDLTNAALGPVRALLEGS
jgi:hypothetical protein